jgi:hypothetical protein
MLRDEVAEGNTLTAEKMKAQKFIMEQSEKIKSKARRKK